MENKAHWVPDVAFREDDSRIRKGDGAENVAIIRRFCLNLARLDGKKNSMRGKLKQAGSIFQYWNEPVEREILPRSQARLYSCSWMVVKRSRRACCSASAAALSLIR